MSGHAREVEERMETFGNDGLHVGTVEKAEGDRVKLTRKDDLDGSGQHHHDVPVSSIAAFEDGKVRLSMPADRAKAHAMVTVGSAPATGMGAVAH